MTKSSLESQISQLELNLKKMANKRRKAEFLSGNAVSVDEKTKTMQNITLFTTQELKIQKSIEALKEQIRKQG